MHGPASHLNPGPRAPIRLVALWMLLCTTLAQAQPAATPEHRHAVLRLHGDLDAQRTATEFADALIELAARRPKLILIELTGNKARPDLLYEAIRQVRDIETPIAIWLADGDDRRVGPGMLALALAAEHAGIHPATSIQRVPEDSLTALNPDIGDWALVRLDLRSVARDLAAATGRDRVLFESTLAPRSAIWATRDASGSVVLTGDEPLGHPPAQQVVRKDADGWSFSANAKHASALYAVAIHATPRAFERSLGVRGRPLETVRVESGLRLAHERCLVLIGKTRAAIGLAEAAIDVRAGRSSTSRTMPHEYHAAAERASGFVASCREAIADIASLTGDYPEILQLRSPPDDDAPTEIGGPARSSLAAWRDAVRDAEYDLSRLDDRIESYRRR